MVLLKISSLLAVLGLLVCQMYSSQAAPARRALEPLPDRVTEAHRLLRALIRELTAEDMEASSSGAAHKRSCDTSTCATQRLADFLSRSGGIGSPDFVPTDVSANSFGRRRRSLHV
uniref:Skin calcitonin gene-related peptide n=1 Tax=Phyllomedusa bicolor TaxID=8393 RepID=CALCB_PHYBI|nr:RecName: Full=Skin calcitonin gene-related peptide; Short=S-CGRP; Flags: Precursor [Phyllomedusa bicolor]CAB76385.1 prepro-skin-calcitonin gene related peptide [Phyllomedusa bicolor]